MRENPNNQTTEQALGDNGKEKLPLNTVSQMMSFSQKYVQLVLVLLYISHNNTCMYDDPLHPNCYPGDCSLFPI